jgi:pSer/pThr/pTyr-binding forkhead associated (FHA) protein
VRDRFGRKDKKTVGAALIVLEGPGKGDEHPLVEEMTIGRTQENSLVRVERGVSRQHCRLRDEGGVFTIEDLGSSNGTLVNEKKIAGLEVLRHGDRIVVGETTFLFHWPEGQVETGLSTSPGLGKMEDDTRPGGPPPAAKRLAALLRKPKVAVPTAIVALLLVGGLAKLVFSGTETLGPSDLSDEPVRYSESMEFRQTAFGLGEFDDAHPDKVIIEFEYMKGVATLRYSAWGIEETGEVVVEVNGQKVGSVPATQEYRHELMLELPREHLRDGRNELVFDNLRNPPEEDAWEIGYVRIVQEPLLPPNEDEARNQLQLGLRLYEDRELDPANRFRAFQKFRRARALLEQVDPRPPLFNEATVMMERLMDELQDKFERGRFSAERAYRFGDVDEAREFLERTMRFFPDPDDVRRDQLAAAIEAIEEG